MGPRCQSLWKAETLIRRTSATDVSGSAQELSSGLPSAVRSTTITGEVVIVSDSTDDSASPRHARQWKVVRQRPGALTCYWEGTVAGTVIAGANAVRPSTRDETRL